MFDDWLKKHFVFWMAFILLLLTGICVYIYTNKSFFICKLQLYPMFNYSLSFYLFVISSQLNCVIYIYNAFCNEVTIIPLFENQTKFK